jgi:hypothetical protein
VAAVLLLSTLADDESKLLLMNEAQSGSWESLISPHTVELKKKPPTLQSSLTKLTSTFDSSSGNQTIG